MSFQAPSVLRINAMGRWIQTATGFFPVLWDSAGASAALSPEPQLLEETENIPPAEPGALAGTLASFLPV